MFEGLRIWAQEVHIFVEKLFVRAGNHIQLDSPYQTSFTPEISSSVTLPMFLDINVARQDGQKTQLTVSSKIAPKSCNKIKFKTLIISPNKSNLEL